MSTSQWIETKWDAAEALVSTHRRKLTVFGFVVVFWPQWFPAAKTFFGGAVAPLLTMDLSSLSLPDWSGWNWLTLPVGLFLIYFAGRKKAVSPHPLLVIRRHEVERLESELQTVTAARDSALQAYAVCRRNFTLHRFKCFGEEHPRATVKIRCAGYDDWALVEQIKTLFEKEARWKVEIDPNNAPPLMPNAYFKVVVETAETGTLHRVHSFLDAEDGGLLPVRVGVYHNPENQDRNHLVVEVLPIVKK